jgi:cation diffusion facilitator CzcD-associated flavoprotein CzcO
MNVLLLEAGDDVGGVWYWNKYPGARFDSESYTYAYSFSEELRQEWNWSELFAGQPEVQRYIARMVEIYDLRQHMRFGSLVTAARYSEEGPTWSVDLATGETFNAQLVFMAVGLLSIPVVPKFEGLESFAGQWWHSSRWPVEPVDLAGKRVAVFGTGSTGVQIIQELADKVGELLVFQRRPSWCAPLYNRPIGAQEMDTIKSRYGEIFHQCQLTPGGFIHNPDRRTMSEVSPDERDAMWEKLYSEPGFGILYANFADVLSDVSANEQLGDFIANKIRERVHDPIVAEKLIPKDHGFGTRRLVLETGYPEVYNRSNVHLVDLLDSPVERITSTSIVTDTSEYVVDVIIFATGFDAMTGSFDHIDITGVGGIRLADRWENGPITFLGLQAHGFPNLFIIGGPQAGSGSSNFPRGLEDGVNWATALVEYAIAHAADRIEATQEAEEWWQEHVADMLSRFLVGKTKSWFTGYNSNLEGRDKFRLLLYMGGARLYRKICNQVAEAGYEGFQITRGAPADKDAPHPFAVPLAIR